MTDTPYNLTDKERLHRLRLIRSENVGPRTFAALLMRFGSAEDAITEIPRLSVRGGRKRAIRVCPLDDALAEIEAADAAGIRLLMMDEQDYPPLVAQIADPPPVLYIRGDAALLRRKSIGMVGARNASANGKRFARTLAADLGKEGFVVASGLARGIDTAAHEGALETGTVAVVAGGVDVVYPKENAELQDRVAAAGAVISEQPLGTQPSARHFPPRNRLISGLSAGVVVVEAAARSGSLITARLAGEQGREVFAIPGSPLDPRAAGPNSLIRNGALLTESAADIVESLEGFFGRPVPESTPSELGIDFNNLEDSSDDADAHDAVASALTTAPVSVDELVRECQLSAASVLAALLDLELAGRVERHPGNRVSLIV